MNLLSILRESPVDADVVWRDHPGSCLCSGGHDHHGDVTAARLADLVEAGDQRAADMLRIIVLSGLGMAVVRCSRSIADARPIVEPLAALAGGPGAVVKDAPSAAATGGEAAVVVQADVQQEEVAVEGLGLVGIGADGVICPGAEGSDLGNGRGLVR